MNSDREERSVVHTTLGREGEGRAEEEANGPGSRDPASEGILGGLGQGGGGAGGSGGGSGGTGRRTTSRRSVVPHAERMKVLDVLLCDARKAFLKRARQKKSTKIGVEEARSMLKNTSLGSSTSSPSFISNSESGVFERMKDKSWPLFCLLKYINKDDLERNVRELTMRYAINKTQHFAAIVDLLDEGKGAAIDVPAALQRQLDDQERRKEKERRAKEKRKIEKENDARKEEKREEMMM